MNTTFDKSLPLAIGADHAGFEYKEEIKKVDLSHTKVSRLVYQIK